MNLPPVDESKAIITQLSSPLLEQKKVQVFIKREDLTHPYLSGNKWRKLKHNLQYAKEHNYDTLLTFGGAFSNHIYATSAAGVMYGFKTIGIIRGEENSPLNPTLAFAQSCGMKLEYVSREDYRLKTQENFIHKLREKFGSFYLIPEGGTNELAIKGASEILNKEDYERFSHITCAVGTGGTLAGLIKASKNKSKILGFSSLKGDFLLKEVNALLGQHHEFSNFKIIKDFHFGGYAKTSPELENFILNFKETHDIPLEFVYTGKLMYGVIEMIKYDYFALKSKILIIHTGGLRP